MDLTEVTEALSGLTVTLDGSAIWRVIQQHGENG